jgi:competence protein ComEC
MSPRIARALLNLTGKLTRSNPFVLIALPFAAGIWLASAFPMPAAVPALAFVTAALAALGAVWLRSATSSAWLAACAALLCLGALHYTLHAPLPAARSVARYNGQWVRLEGIVADEPDVRPTHTNLRLKPLRIHTAGVSDEALDDLVLVRVETQKYRSDSEALRSRVRRDYEDWPYGSLVHVEGLLDAPPRMHSFDYREYLARRQVFSWMRQPRKLLKVGEAPENWLYARLLEFKNVIRQEVWNSLPDREAALFSGILLGDARGMPDDLKEAFRRTGTSHLIAISGSNFSILIALTLPLMIRLVGRQQAAGLALPAIVLYAVFVGLEASVVRAAVMAGVGLIGMLLWRRGLTLNTLCAAAFILLLYDPHMLFDAGFQLSFAATLGLALYADRLSGRLRDWASSHIPHHRAQRAFLFVSEGALLTLVTHLTTLPVQWLIFESFSSVALITNMLVVPLQPPLMILGALGSLIATAIAAMGGVGQLALLPAQWLSSLTILIVEGFAKFTYALLPVPFFSLPAAAAYYAILLGFTAFLFQPVIVRRAIKHLLWTHRAVLSISVAGLTALGLGVLLWFQRPDGRLHVTFVGSSAIIRSPDGAQAVFLGDGDVVNPLRRMMPVGDGELELLIVPQRSERHWRNAGFLLAHYRVRELVLPPGRDQVTDDLAAARQVVRRNAAQVVTAADGTTLALGRQVSLTIALRMPARDGQQTIGTRLRYGEVNIDLVGDQQAINYEPRSTLVFLGWAQADVAALKAAGPRWVVWTDGAGLPPALGVPIRTLNLKEISEVALMSDGQQLILR